MMYPKMLLPATYWWKRALRMVLAKDQNILASISSPLIQNESRQVEIFITRTYESVQKHLNFLVMDI